MFSGSEAYSVVMIEPAVFSGYDSSLRMSSRSACATSGRIASTRSSSEMLEQVDAIVGGHRLDDLREMLAVHRLDQLDLLRGSMNEKISACRSTGHARAPFRRRHGLSRSLQDFGHVDRVEPRRTPSARTRHFPAASAAGRAAADGERCRAVMRSQETRVKSQRNHVVLGSLALDSCLSTLDRKSAFRELEAAAGFLDSRTSCVPPCRIAGEEAPSLSRMQGRDPRLRARAKCPAGSSRLAGRPAPFDVHPDVDRAVSSVALSGLSTCSRSRSRRKNSFSGRPLITICPCRP